MQSFCTLFDSNYLSRGLAMYASLVKVSSHFHLYVFAFDDLCYSTLVELDLEHVTVISLAEFEDESLLRVKVSRSVGEYCWTCTSSAILYVFEEYKVTQCTYLDADIYFYSSPGVLFDEMGGDSILLTPHRFTDEFDIAATAGKYNVQFMPFRNNVIGLKALRWWRERCLEACRVDSAQGLSGDQKYLNDWPTRFNKVCELGHLGGGVAPWNVQQYEFYCVDKKVMGKTVETGKKFELVFFHFHALKLLTIYTLWGIPVWKNMSYSVYPIPESATEHIYKPYIDELKCQEAQLERLISGYKICPAGQHITEFESLAVKKFNRLSQWIHRGYLNAM